MNTKTQNLPFRENQKNHRAYISANVRKTLDTTGAVEEVHDESACLPSWDAKSTRKARQSQDTLEASGNHGTEFLPD
jgi:ribosomal protein L28